LPQLLAAVHIALLCYVSFGAVMVLFASIIGLIAYGFVRVTRE